MVERFSKYDAIQNVDSIKGEKRNNVWLEASIHYIIAFKFLFILENVNFLKIILWCELIKYLHPESIFHVEESVFEQNYVNDVE